MTIFVGEAVTIKASATDPLRGGTVISDATGEVEFYAVGDDAKNDPTARTSEHGPFPLTFDAAVVNKDGSLGAYLAYVDTTGWVEGKRLYKVTLTGSYDTWEYGSLSLKA